MAVAALAILLLAVHNRRARHRLWWGLAVFGVLLAGAFVLFRDNDRFENTFFHTNEHSQSAESSNAQHLSALGDGLYEVAHEPFGRGPGTAGPASAHNVRPARIAESYYLQIGQEVGWLGLGLFVTILVLVACRLWYLRTDPLARALLVSLIGICTVNAVQHAWTDDTLALVWWGLAGVALSAVSLRGRRT